jgi:hypothetical protein
MLPFWRQIGKCNKLAVVAVKHCEDSGAADEIDELQHELDIVPSLEPPSCW